MTTHPLLAPRWRMSRAVPLLPLWALGGLYRVTFTFKIFKKQKDEIRAVLNIINTIVNLKQRIYFTFYGTTCVTMLQKAYSF
jgi:hypothetical protein